MGHELSAKSEQQLERFCRQFLQLDIFDWPDKENLRNDAFQEALYARLFAENAIEHSPPPRYRLRVLKELTKRIEQSIVDWDEEGISDNLMTYLSTLFSSPLPSEVTSAQQKAYVTYTISSLPSSPKPATITLFEARSLVAASGTTGLRTWEAALHLGNYLTTDPELVKGKSVLELGAGTGYLSILCTKHLGTTQVISTDGSEEVVAGLPTNFYLNGLEEPTSPSLSDPLTSPPKITAKELRWGQALLGTEHPHWNNGHAIDIVLGADVTYDSASIASLIATFGDLFELFPQVKIVIAATIRNSGTFETFLETCRRNGYGVEGIKYSAKGVGEQEGPFYRDGVPIELCVVTRHCV